MPRLLLRLRLLLWIGAAASAVQAVALAARLPPADGRITYEPAGGNGRDLVFYVVVSAVATLVLAAAAITLRHTLMYLGTGAVLARTVLTPGEWSAAEIVAAVVGPLALVAAILLLRKAG